MNIFKHILVLIIVGYQRLVSPYFPSSCRFDPTCSNYAKEAIDILNRIHRKIDVLLEKQKEHLEQGHPRDDGK